MPREDGEDEHAKAVLELLWPKALAGDTTERIHHLEHIRALLQTERGELGSACNKHLEVVSNAAKHIRSLFWLRLDLANWLRQRARADEALDLFMSMVRPRSGKVDRNRTNNSTGQTPTSHDICAAAESALRLVRASRSNEAEVILQANDIRWVAPEAFHITLGGEMTDTAWINDSRLQQLMSTLTVVEG